MARKSDGEKIDELEKIVAGMMERLTNTIDSLRALGKAHSEGAASVTDFRRECEREMALLKREMDDLKKWREEQKKERDESARRLWAFGPNVLGAVVSSLIAAVVAYFIARR